MKQTKVLSPEILELYRKGGDKVYTIEQLEKIKIGSKEWKEVAINYLYAPMELSIKDIAPYQIWIGIRWAGKTWGMSNEIIKHYYETGQKTLLLYENLKEIQDNVDLSNFKDDHKEEYWKHIVGEKTILKSAKKHNNEENDSDDTVAIVAAISKAERLKPKSWKKFDFVWQDEIFKETYQKRAAFKITDICTTVQRDNVNFKFVGTGNAVSINAPIFRALEIDRITNNIVTTIYDEEGKPFIRVFNWITPLEILEARVGHLASFKMAKRNGYIEYAFKNIMKNDNIDNIVHFTPAQIKKFTYRYTFKLEDKMISRYDIPGHFNAIDGKQLTWFNYEKDKKRIARYALNKDYVESKVVLNTDITEKLAELYQIGRLIYDTPAIEQMLKVILRPFYRAF